LQMATEVHKSNTFGSSKILEVFQSMATEDERQRRSELRDIFYSAAFCQDATMALLRTHMERLFRKLHLEEGCRSQTSTAGSLLRRLRGPRGKFQPLVRPSSGLRSSDLPLQSSQSVRTTRTRSSSWRQLALQLPRGQSVWWQPRFFGRPCCGDAERAGRRLRRARARGCRGRCEACR
jgi:hypothetical protein